MQKKEIIGWWARAFFQCSNYTIESLKPSTSNLNC
jgi:hypothetical protein